MPVQVYEYATAECLQPGKDSNTKKMAEANIGKNDSTSDDGMKDVLCAYQAGCMPVPENAPDEPKNEISQSELIDKMMAKGSLKGSILICKGRGAVDSKGIISDANCPSPSRCQKQLLYNFGSRSLNPSDPKAAGVDPNRGAK